MAEGEQVAIRYAVDEHGIRRRIVGDDPVPDGWTVEQSEPEPEPPKRGVKSS